MSATDIHRRRRLQVALALLVAAVQTVWAAGASAPTITEADIERARQSQPVVTDGDIEAARRKHQPPGERLPSPPITGPRIDALPRPAMGSPIDLESLARGYASQTDSTQAAQGLATGPGLFIFVSLSMPRPTLQRLLDQAARARASVILRGLINGSLRETVSQVQPLIGERRVAIQIDPQAFDRFAITRVPSFVLIRDGARPASCAAGACPPPEAFLRTAGDVSLDYALEHMQRAAPGFRVEAAGFLRRLGR